jgi:hypothetical protein
MAVTAHWVQGVEIETTAGSQKKLELRTDLIGFNKIPGRHKGKHLAHCFIHVLDRVKITHKVLFSCVFFAPLLICSQIGWVTCDNASNNDTMMVSLEEMLHKQKIKFDAVENRIR